MNELELHRVEHAILKPMRKLYGPPRNVEDEAGALRQYAEDLHQFTTEVLETAWKTVRQNHAYKSWPTIATIIKACHEARRSGSSRVGEPFLISRERYRNANKQTREIMENAIRDLPHFGENYYEGM